MVVSHKEGRSSLLLYLKPLVLMPGTVAAVLCPYSSDQVEQGVMGRKRGSAWHPEDIKLTAFSLLDLPHTGILAM